MLHAHPLEDSYSAALRDTVAAALADSGVDHEIVRLCRDEVPGADLRTVEHLIAVCPTWWGGPPAVLLGWLQDTLGDVVDGTASPSPLAGVDRLSVVTTHGSSLLTNNMQGQPGKQTWARVIAPLCAPGVDFEWVALYKIDRSDEPERQAFLDHVRTHFTTATVPA